MVALSLAVNSINVHFHETWRIALRLHSVCILSASLDVGSLLDQINQMRAYCVYVFGAELLSKLGCLVVPNGVVSILNTALDEPSIPLTKVQSSSSNIGAALLTAIVCLSRSSLALLEHSLRHDLISFGSDYSVYGVAGRPKRLSERP